jgi:PilZ domain
MDGPLARYISRSPRYILQAQDNTLIRVAGPHQTPWEEGTEIRNVSLSGLAFTAANDFCPRVDELIKIQFEAPGASQMACFATVSRIEQGPTTSLVAVKFIQLEFSQRIYLHQSLSKKMREQNSRLNQETRRLFWREKGFRFGLAIALLLAWSALNWFWWRN